MSLRRQIGDLLSTYNLNSRFTKQLLEFSALHIGQFMHVYKSIIGQDGFIIFERVGEQ